VLAEEVVWEMTVTLWKSSLIAKMMTSKMKCFDTIVQSVPSADKEPVGVSGTF
jgi:hypothetical protein